MDERQKLIATLATDIYNKEIGNHHNSKRKGITEEEYKAAASNSVDLAEMIVKRAERCI